MKSSVGLGGNISKSIYSMKDGEIPTPEFITYTSKDDSGNGSLMRLSPIPVFFSHFHGDKQLIDIALEFAKRSSFTTHPGYIAAEACALMSYIIIHAIHRPPTTNFAANNNENDEEEKKDADPDGNEDETMSAPKEDVKAFLEDMTSKYLKRIEREYAELINTLKELIKSKEYNHVKKKIEAMNKRRNKRYGKDEDDDTFDAEMTQSFLEDDDVDENDDDNDNDNDDDNDEQPKVNEDKYMITAWSKIQEKLNHIHREIVAKDYIMRLIKSEEPDDSTERCWNWKTKYGDLGIDLTM